MRTEIITQVVKDIRNPNSSLRQNLGDEALYKAHELAVGFNKILDASALGIGAAIKRFRQPYAKKVKTPIYSELLNNDQPAIEPLAQSAITPTWTPNKLENAAEVSTETTFSTPAASEAVLAIDERFNQRTKRYEDLSARINQMVEELQKTRSLKAAESQPEVVKVPELVSVPVTLTVNEKPGVFSAKGESANGQHSDAATPDMSTWEKFAKKAKERELLKRDDLEATRKVDNGEFGQDWIDLPPFVRKQLIEEGAYRELPEGVKPKTAQPTNGKSQVEPDGYVVRKHPDGSWRTEPVISGGSVDAPDEEERAVRRERVRRGTPFAEPIATPTRRRHFWEYGPFAPHTEEELERERRRREEFAREEARRRRDERGRNRWIVPLGGLALILATAGGWWARGEWDKNITPYYREHAPYHIVLKAGDGKELDWHLPIITPYFANGPRNPVFNGDHYYLDNETPAERSDRFRAIQQDNNAAGLPPNGLAAENLGDNPQGRILVPSIQRNSDPDTKNYATKQEVVVDIAKEHPAKKARTFGKDDPIYSKIGRPGVSSPEGLAEAKTAESYLGRSFKPESRSDQKLFGKLQKRPDYQARYSLVDALLRSQTPSNQFTTDGRLLHHDQNGRHFPYPDYTPAELQKIMKQYLSSYQSAS